jgi:uncharacterized membrane protein YecN with MAPEG domain
MRSAPEPRCHVLWHRDSMRIVGLYAGLLALIHLFLWTRISDARVKLKVSMLDGGNVDLATRIRRHANFAENVPLALLLLTLVASNGGAPMLLHILGAALLLGRILHPLGMRHDVIPHPLRAVGAGATFVVTLAAAVVAVWQFASTAL